MQTEMHKTFTELSDYEIKDFGKGLHGFLVEGVVQVTGDSEFVAKYAFSYLRELVRIAKERGAIH